MNSRRKEELEMENPVDELRPEYDLRTLRLRKAGPGRKSLFGENIVRLKPDVAEMFPDSKSVNEALRFLIRAVQRNDSQYPF
jgi:hypothetical protein